MIGSHVVESHFFKILWLIINLQGLIGMRFKTKHLTGNIEGFLLETEPQIEDLIQKLSASPADAAIQPSAYMQLVELFNKVCCHAFIGIAKDFRWS